MKKILIISAFILSLLPLSAVIHMVGNYDTPGNASHVFVTEGIVYVADGWSGLRLVDVSNPQNPFPLGFYDTPGSASSVAVEDSIAYVADGSFGLKIIDVTNPLNPFLISNYETTEDVTSVSVNDGIAYIIAGGLRIIDVSNPQFPVQTGYIDVGGEYVSVVDSVAYVTCYMGIYGSSGRLNIIDVTNPQNPSLLGFCHCNRPLSVTISGAIAYVTDLESGLHVIDVSVPQNPILLGSYEQYSGYSVTVLDSIAYVAGGDLKIIDVSNPQNPVLLESFDTQGAKSVIISDNFVYVGAEASGLLIIDITDLQNQLLLGSYECNTHFVAVQDDIAYVAELLNGCCVNYSELRIISVIDPQFPTVLDSLYCGEGGRSFAAVDGNLVYLVGDGLQIIDVSDLNNPELLGVCYTGAQYVTVSGNIAYLTGYYALQIIDVSNPQNPNLISSCATPETPNSVVVSGGIAYLACGWSGLQIINVSNPQNPILLGSCYTPYQALSVAVAGNIAYVAAGGLQIINLSNPASPALVGSIMPHTTSNVNLCYIQNNLLYISDKGWNEISIYNISNPQSPVLENRYAWNISTESMCVNGNRLYTSNSLHGMYIHDLSTLGVDDLVQYPATAFQMRNYPNPFNPETTISYTLPAKGQVCLNIYNSKGQLVKSLLDGPQAKGEHTLTWDGKDDAGHSVASGLYLCRITFTGKQETKKMLLLK